MIEHLLFACCLEDAHHDAAEEAFAALVHTFFDWNEVRVTSISELSEVMACLPDPRAAANRIKRVLHAVFEATFNFDLEDLRKKNLGPTITWLEKLDGTTPFVVSYVVQAALGGHAIPIDAGTMAVLRVLDLVTEKDVGGRRRAGARTRRGQVEGDRVRVDAPRARRRLFRQSVLLDHPRHSAANRPGVRKPPAQAAGRRAQRKPHEPAGRRKRRPREEGTSRVLRQNRRARKKHAAADAPSINRRPSRQRRKPASPTAAKPASSRQDASPSRRFQEAIRPPRALPSASRGRREG